MSTCRYFNTPRGCRNNPCHFIHGLPPETDGGVIRNSGGFSSVRSMAPQLQLTSPYGTCRFYYNLGDCKHAEQCRYKHVEPGTSVQRERFEPARPFFGSFATTSPAEATSMTAAGALRRLTAYCVPRFSFTKPTQMVPFVKILIAADPKKGKWDTKDAQKALERVTEGHGATRIEYILAYPQIVSRIQTPNEISFASTYLSCLSYMVADFVLDSTLEKRVNLLFGIFHTHYAHFNEIVTRCMHDMVSRRSFDDPGGEKASGAAIFNALSLVLTEYLIRVKSALREHRSLPLLVENLSQWFDSWKIGGFSDGWVPENDHDKRITIERLENQITRLVGIVGREAVSISRKDGKAYGGGHLRLPHEGYNRQQATLIGPLEIHYDPAGHLRELGPRHDNDFENIQMIEIPPTQEEMISPMAPFLPANIPGAPHHLPAESMERLLDIQFRLLREELLAPLRAAVRMVMTDLRDTSRDTLLQPILDKKGGLYVAQTGQLDSVMIRLYTSVNPLRITTDRRGISVELMMDTPPGSARNISPIRRIEYWRAVSRKRLMQGGLVGILWQNGQEIQLFFGLIASYAQELQSSVEDNNESILLKVKFFDPNIHVKLMAWFQHGPGVRSGSRILLIEAPVMYEAIRPLLQALQREPTSFPFSQYLAHRQYVAGQSIQVACPRYTITRPDFTWDLHCLLDGDQPPLHLDPADPASVDQARFALRTSSRLDNSQAEAMVDCLTREFSLIQGPPGTGKSFTGVEIMRVLLANGVGRILLIAFTNHALDHLLRSVLKADLTRKIVRLGSRSGDEQIAKFSLENIERFDSGSTQDRSSITAAYWARRNAEQKLNEVLANLQEEEGLLSDEHREEYMEIFRPEHQHELTHPPPWIEQLRSMNIGWIEVGGKTSQEVQSEYQFWISSKDVQWLRAQIAVQGARHGRVKDNKNLEEKKDHSMENEETELRNQFLRQAGLAQFPSLPTSRRPIDELQEDPMVWLMSSEERERLDRAWTAAMREYFFESKKKLFLDLKTEYEDAHVAYDECQSQARLEILEKADIIGCTTTGAAKLTKLLNGVRPSVLLIEEAGQVLEAHVIGSLVQSIQHVIMIGDPFQLRPTISNYALSMDHSRGKEIYKFDQSTMERLGNSGLPMSKLSVQRRMRPQISSIARRTLYNQLEDHEQVKSYPDVRGLGKNMFFFHHTHAEGGIDEESTSKFNTFEVSMIKGLVQHLLRQGSYTKPGSIVVLCMYLGQLAKIRDELREIRINVILDSRDVEELRSREVDGDISEEVITDVAEVKVTDQVLLRTVDNFQGEEADIVLLSLVRNPGEGQSGAIGFLKSTNRANVALTRARHGLYVFGNGELLAQKSPMWKQVIQEFKDEYAYGSELLIACHRHPTEMHWVENATHLRHISPDGGCLRPCNYRLNCGHTCPSKCHSDDEDHLFVRCYEPCRLLCRRGHPCTKACWVSCGDCIFPSGELFLDCGHVLQEAPCHLKDDQSTFRCRERVKKQMPTCEHQMVLDCFQDPSDVSCRAICNETMGCCQKPCRSRCGECQMVSLIPGTRGRHKGHPCDRVMHCQHLCSQACSSDHSEKCGTSDCQGPCRQSCSHHTCTRGCSEPCTPCMEPCPWKCEHHECCVPCGSPCVRLPCDVPCTRVLRCGHKCPSLCGEPCGQQLCPNCATKEQKEKVVDLILGLTFSDIDPLSPGLDNITITLQCRHTFTVETLDGHCELEKAYEWDERVKSWRRPLLSSENFVKTPCCPTCRAPISVRRYGRVTKRGNLDLLERNIATRMARELRSIQILFRNVDLVSMQETVKKSVVSRPAFALSAKKSLYAQKLRQNLARDPSASILPLEFLNLQANKQYQLPTEDSERWTVNTSPLLDLYQRCLKLVKTRTAHSSAHDAAFSMLYKRELQLAKQGPRPPKSPEIFAMQVAKTKMGMAPPRADTRFQVEAIWISVDIRGAIGGLAEKYLSCLSERTSSTAQRQSWTNFTALIYDSCTRDAQCAMMIARTTNAHRQELLSGLRIFKGGWRRTQFSVLAKQNQREGIKVEEREMLSKQVEEGLLSTRAAATSLRALCISNGNMQESIVNDEFDVPLEHTFKHWEALIVKLNRPTVFYQAVSEEERLQVVGSFTEYLHRGHWYTCPNGHIFTIADCGGAMETGRCNECGAAIGGTRHQTVTGVSQAVDLERIAEAQGARASPWAWNGNV